MGNNTIFRWLVLALLLGLGTGAAQNGDVPQVEYSPRVSLPSLGGVGGGGGGLGGISDLLSKSNSGAMVSDFTGQPAFPVSLGGISTPNGLSYPVSMSYYGGSMDAIAGTHPAYSPGSWVGTGFTLKPPFIQVQGEDYTFENQKYFLSLDGVSQQEMIQEGTSDDFVLKNNPFVHIHRVGGSSRTIELRDNCPNQSNQQFSFSSPYISYWTVDLADGTEYVFGDEGGDCDASESELCQPVVGTNLKYNPFYSLELNAKSALTFFASTIRDRQRQSAIWFRYDKIQEQVTGSCNSINTTPTFTTLMDRAIYLKEIYSTNGIAKGDFQTSKMVFITAPKTEEPIFPQSAASPSTFYENKKLTGIQYYEKGNLVSSLAFNYISQQGRLALSNIQAQNPFFSTTRNFLTLEYVPGTLRIQRIRDSQGRLVEFGYGTVQSDPINGTNPITGIPYNPDHQILETNGAFSPNTHIAFTRQIGNKFYLETENWSTNPSCLDSPTPSVFMERLYEYEFDGTYWSLKQTYDAPERACPTEVDFFMAPDGKYFIWAFPSNQTTERFDIYETRADGPARFATSLYSTHTAGIPRRTEIYTYSNWFAIYNTEFQRDLTFVTKNSSGAWTMDCPSAIAPSTYLPPTTYVSRNANFSGEDEGIDPNSCLTFSEPIRVFPGPNALAVVNTGRDILHVFADNGGIKDYVTGLETTTPPLPNFTTAQVGDGSLRAKSRPWFRHVVTGTVGDIHYDNNWDQHILNVAMSENLIAVTSQTGVSDWQYLYVLGWDGNQLRYLYDEGIAADQTGDDIREPLDVAVGPDYFVVKNAYSPGGHRGIFYYKVDLKTWRVVPPTPPVTVPPTPDPWPPATSLPNGLFNVLGEDWAIKAYPDLVFIEKMSNKNVDSAYGPAWISNGANSGSSDIGGIFFKSLTESYVFMLDANRLPLDISSNFRQVTSMPFSSATDFAAQGDRILTAESHKNPNTSSTNVILTNQNFLWKRNPDPSAAVPYDKYVMPDPDPATATDHYYTSRLVTGGVITTKFTKTATQASLYEIDFYPDVFDLVPKAGDPSQKAHSATVVTSVSVKTAGANSTGNNVQTITLSYPTSSPDGDAGAILKNYQSGVPNFKYVRKDFAEGAEVTGFLRDELFAKVPQEKSALIGSAQNTWTLPDKVSYRKPGGATTSSLALTAAASGKPSTALAVEPVQNTSKSYFFNAHRSSLTNQTAFDSKSGQPKITVSKVAGKYVVALSQYQQDLDQTFTGPFNLLRQVSNFQFDTDPCSRNPGEDPCGNLSLAWFTLAQMPHIVSSSIMTYDASNRLMDTFQWRADALGTVYPPLNGIPTETGTGWKWVKVNSITAHQDHAVALCKSDAVTESNQMGVYTSNYYGGPECDLLGTIQNSPLFSSALLNGEEDIMTGNCANPGACLGAFGQWEAAGSIIQSRVVHTGNKAIQATGQFGPSINLQIRKAPGFMDRKKGFFASAWVLAMPNSDPAFRIEFRKCTVPPTPVLVNDPVVYAVDVVQEYIATKGPLPTGKWVKLERMIPYEELSSKGIFGVTTLHPTSSDYLRIWLGKNTATTADPVYIDDVRLYPADAGVTTQNYNAFGQVSSSLDSQNEPTFFEYDVWGSPAGARRKDGMVETANAVKLFNE